MRHQIFSVTAAAVFLSAFVVGVSLFGVNIYGRYLRISRGKATLLLLAAVFASIGFGVWRAHDLERTHEVFHFVNDDDFDEGLSVVFATLLPWVAIPFLAKLYLAWIAGAATDAEKAPGMEGVRAWLRVGNLIFAVLISLCLWIGFGDSFLVPMMLALMALLAYPVLNMAMSTTPPAATAPATENLSPERERVLKLLDDGKITAPESAELLNALSHSAPPRTVPSAPVPHRKMVLIGLALLVIGFFLPWFVIKVGDVQQAMNNLMGQIPMPQGMNLAGMMPQGLPTGTTLYVTGGDIAHGLGWCVLLLGIVAAVLPFVATNLDSQTCQKTCLVVLGVGAIILIYLLTQNIRFAGIGLLLGLAGYALEFIGVLKARELDWVRAA